MKMAKLLKRKKMFRTGYRRPQKKKKKIKHQSSVQKPEEKEASGQVKAKARKLKQTIDPPRSQISKWKKPTMIYLKGRIWLEGTQPVPKPRIPLKLKPWSSVGVRSRCPQIWQLLVGEQWLRQASKAKQLRPQMRGKTKMRQ